MATLIKIAEVKDVPPGQQRATQNDLPSQLQVITLRKKQPTGYVVLL
jgi:hypothetical protein